MPAKKKRDEPVLTQLVDGQACVTIAEAAKLKGVSRQAIWVRVQRGTLPHVRVGGRLYIPLAALKDLGV